MITEILIPSIRSGRAVFDIRPAVFICSDHVLLLYFLHKFQKFDFITVL